MAEKAGSSSSNSSLSLPTANTARQHLGAKKKSDTKQIHPGYSMFDWNKLCNSGEVDMTGTKGKMLRVSPEELARHNRDGDLWTAVRGVVYNVTHFTKFHPGGKAQLMRGAGRDCTELFDKVIVFACAAFNLPPLSLLLQIHVWVNSEAILEKCIVGYLIGAQPPVKSSTLKVAVEKPPFPGGSSGEADKGVDVLSLNVPSMGGGGGGGRGGGAGTSRSGNSSASGGSGGKLSIADAGRLQRTMKSPSTDTEDGNISISIPVPTTFAPSQSPHISLGVSAAGRSPIPASRNMDSPQHATSSSLGVPIPVPTKVGSAIPASPLSPYITDHPLISKTAYETSV